ncbi:9398_t:CDS:2, partial [Scutellospora calospora]
GKPAIKEIVKQYGKNITIIVAIDRNEKAFSKVKNLVARHHLADYETILKRIDDVFDIVTREDCRNWIRHSISYFDFCQDEERIKI